MLFFSFWKIFCCCCEPLGKSLLNLSHYCFCFMLSFFWPWGMWGLSSPTRDWTHTPGIRRWSLNHWTTTEVPHSYSYYCILYCYWWHLRQKPRNPLVSLLCNQLSNSDCLSFFFWGKILLWWNTLKFLRVHLLNFDLHAYIHVSQFYVKMESFTVIHFWFTASSTLKVKQKTSCILIC